MTGSRAPVMFPRPRGVPITLRANSPMITFLFWNSKHATHDMIAALVAEQHADVLVLAERDVDDDALLDAIERIDGARFSADPIRGDVAIFTRCPITHLGHESDEPRMSIRRLATTPEDILLVAVHLRSKERTSDGDQAALTPGYAYEIRRIEEKLGHRRTVLVGDLNMNPFDHGVVQASGFHAIPSHRIATGRGTSDRKGERRVDGRSYPFFYNPMWNCFGDERGAPPGTFFRDRGDPITYFWHLYDQVLVRPALVGRFLHPELKILTRCGSMPLVTREGVPDSVRASDHLPLRFCLDLELPGANR